MTVGDDDPGMRGLRIVGGALALVAAFAASACGGDDSTGDTLGPLDPNAGGSALTVASVAGSSPSDTVVDPALAGAGFVSIQVRLPAVGLDETISLDRASVRADDLDPISLDATCAALDGAPGAGASVVDLRRLGSGARLVSVTVRVEADTTAAGSYDGTIDVGGADQVTTTYTGKVTIDEGGAAGSFEATDASGNAATGTFVCAAEPVAPATTPPATGGGEEVPDSLAATPTG